MSSLPDRPRVRPVEILPYEEKGRRSFLVQDPAGHLEAPLQLSPAALLLLSLCDGSRTKEEIRVQYQTKTTRPLESAELDEFLTTMDGALLLESPRFAAHRERLEAEFAATPWRVAAHAGAAYESDPAKLAAKLDGWLAGGIVGGRPDGRLLALVAPHIDFHRGGAGYGKAYAALRDREAPDVVVVLGTGHSASEGRFILCDKGFETPAGRLAADRDFLARLEKRLPRDHHLGALAHRREHSIEFQAVWLAHLFPHEPRPTIVPILCTTFDDFMESKAGPHGNGPTSDFLDALRETWHEERRRVLVVAGADLAHVGPRFGDDRRTTPEFMEHVRARDVAALEGAKRGSADRFFAAVAEHGNCDRICSVAAIFAALHTVGASGGDVTVYDQAIDASGQLAVTFAGVALYGSDDGPGLARTVAARRTIKQTHVESKPAARPTTRRAPASRSRGPSS